MCGIVGIVNTKQNINIENYRNVLKNMSNKINKRGPDEEGFFYDNNCLMSHKRLIVIDPEGGKQPMNIKYNDTTYTIVYNGQLYNTSELRNRLEEAGFSFKTHSDTEVLLKSYIHYGYDVVTKLNGIFSFAIWNNTKKELFIARDHFGIKPFYYYFKNDAFLFASEVKCLFEFPYVVPTIDSTSISELFGLGPAHTSGNGIFKDIYELKPAHFAILNNDGLNIKQYWKLKSMKHTDTFEETCKKTKDLLEDSIKRQLVSDVPLCTFLSGGLDSSIISLYAANYYKDNNLGKLNTYSVDYIDNDKNFHKTDFQPNSDKYYIDIMLSKIRK